MITSTHIQSSLECFETPVIQNANTLRIRLKIARTKLINFSDYILRFFAFFS